MSLIVLDIELTEKDIIKKLGLHIDGSLQEFSFCPPTTCKANKQTKCITRHPQKIAWSGGKIDYDKLFAIFYDIKSSYVEQVQFYKKLSLYFIGWSFRNWKIAAYLQLPKKWNPSTKV